MLLVSFYEDESRLLLALDKLYTTKTPQNTQDLIIINERVDSQVVNKHQKGVWETKDSDGRRALTKHRPTLVL